MQVQHPVEESSEHAAGSTAAPTAPRLTPQQNRMLLGGIVVVVVLIVIGLLLPPISLGDRLGITGADDPAAEAAAENALVVPGEFVLNVTGGERVSVTPLAQQDFLGSELGEAWQAAAAAVPARLQLAGNVYAIESRGDVQPTGTAALTIPDAAPAPATLDVYGWDGESWLFVPVDAAESGRELTTLSGPLPQALALMQTASPAELAVAAEVRPTQSLPAAVLPHLTEVAAGTLTLGPDGALLGEVAAVPEGGYRQLLRATNTGAIVDTASLSAVLSDPNARAANIQALVDRAEAGGFAGVNLDYQGVAVDQQAAFSAFVDELGAALDQAGLLLVVTLEAPVKIADGWDTAGHDWAAIGRAADGVYVQLPLDPLAYADGGPAEQILAWATRRIDRAKVMAQVGAGAVDAVGEAVREVDDEQVLDNFGALSAASGATEIEPGEEIEVALSGTAGELAWDPDSLTYAYSYEQAGQAHRVWLDSAAAFAHRGRLAIAYHLRGIAVRGLGRVADGEAYAAALQSLLGAAEAPAPTSAAIVWAVETQDGAVVASDSSETTGFSWEAPESPGRYVIRADFAQGEQVASLGTLRVEVKSSEPTATPEPTAESTAVAQATPGATSAPARPVSPGSADLAANTEVNVRSGPGLGYGIIGLLNTGATASITGRNADSTWLQITNSAIDEGWVFATLVTVNTSVTVASLPVIEVEPPAGGVAGAPPPVIAPAAGGSFELGGQTHSLGNPTLMGQAGMNWVKFQHKWSPGNVPSDVAGRIQQAHGNGFKVLLSIPGANAYPGSIDFGAYVDFLGGVAALGPDAIEVWNEENIDFEWPAGQIDPAAYVNSMLAPAYNAIKAANSGVMVVSGAPAPTGFHNVTNAWSDDRYMAGVAAAGGGSYMDCIGVHFNAGATSPNATSGHPADGGGGHYSWYFWPTLNMYYNAFGGARPVCFTELGYLSGQDFGGVPSRFSWAGNTTVAQHAQWLGEAASLSANSGKVRLMIIFNVDFTAYGEDPQAGYAILRPDGSCPACGVLAQVMGN